MLFLDPLGQGVAELQRPVQGPVVLQLANGSRRAAREPDELLTEVARNLALAMAYEDTVRVAELKIRASRFERVRKEAAVKPGR